MHYYEVVPHALLRPFVRCVWGLRIGDARPELQRVLPDGCCELVVHCGDRFTQQLEGRSVTQPTRLFVGPSTRALSIAPGPTVDVIAVRFEPGGAALLIGAPLASLRETVAALDDIEVGFGFDIVDALAPLGDAPRVALLEGMLLRRLHRMRVDREVMHTQQTI